MTVSCRSGSARLPVAPRVDSSQRSPTRPSTASSMPSSSTSRSAGAGLRAISSSVPESRGEARTSSTCDSSSLSVWWRIDRRMPYGAALRSDHEQLLLVTLAEQAAAAQPVRPAAEDRAERPAPAIDDCGGEAGALERVERRPLAAYRGVDEQQHPGAGQVVGRAGANRVDEHAAGPAGLPRPRDATSGQ